MHSIFDMHIQIMYINSWLDLHGLWRASSSKRFVAVLPNTLNTRNCITHFPASRENPNASQHPVKKPCGLHIFVDLMD